jgi:enamine deaminase RidA (YjgF/YER057c/UK114 family)
MAILRKKTNNRMSQIVVHGNTVYLAGQVAQDSPGTSVEEQTQSILNQIDSLLSEAGTNKDNMLSATIWLNSMADFDAMNSVWDKWVPSGKAPCRACVESPKLAADHFNVEIGIIAAK